MPRLLAERIFTHQAHNWQKDGTKWRGGCPWHESKSGTSFNIDTETLLWYCPACQVGGGPVQYLHKLGNGAGVSPRGKDFVKIVRKLADLAGVEIPEADPETERKRETRRAILSAVILRTESLLWSPICAPARAWLVKRGFSEADAKSLRCGYFDSAEGMRKALAKAGFSRTDISESVVAVAKMEGYVTFPWHDDAGRPLTLYGCLPGEPTPLKPKKMALPNPESNGVDWENTKRSPLYLDRALRAGHRDVVLVEGVTDAALAQARGDTRVVACVAASLSKQQTRTLARRKVKSLTLALDPDTAGDKGIQSCVKALEAAKIKVLIAPRLPDGMDPDDHINAKGIDAWRMLIAAARAVGEPVLMPIALGELVAKHPRLRDPLVEGVLRLGESLNIISVSKQGKSWLAISLALAVATGQKWLDTFPTDLGRVLILDNELHPETLAHRVPKVAEALGIDMADVGDKIDVLTLRGRLTDMLALGAFFRGVEKARYKLIVVDALYRTLPKGTDENGNGAMAEIYNAIDHYADLLGAAFCLIHHSSKGNQGAKSVTDVGSGAGALSRACDAHLILRPHEEEDVVVLEAAVRSWPPVKPLCLAWEFPLWKPAPEFDPSQLKGGLRPRTRAEKERERTAQAKADDADVLVTLDRLTERKGQTPSRNSVLEETPISKPRATRAVGRLLDDGVVEELEIVVATGRNLKATKNVPGFRRKTRSGD
jgi:hypothetical protein